MRMGLDGNGLEVRANKQAPVGSEDQRPSWGDDFFVLFKCPFVSIASSAGCVHCGQDEEGPWTGVLVTHC
jgi:hypothetical protein